MIYNTTLRLLNKRHRSH